MARGCGDQRDVDSTASSSQLVPIFVYFAYRPDDILDIFIATQQHAMSIHTISSQARSALGQSSLKSLYGNREPVSARKHLSICMKRLLQKKWISIERMCISGRARNALLGQRR